MCEETFEREKDVDNQGDFSECWPT